MILLESANSRAAVNRSDEALEPTFDTAADCSRSRRVALHEDGLECNLFLEPIKVASGGPCLRHRPCFVLAPGWDGSGDAAAVSPGYLPGFSFLMLL
jgi:hypothetical protein